MIINVHLSLRTLSLTILLAGFPLVAFGAQTTEHLTSERVLSLARRHLENNSIYKDIDWAQPPSEEKIFCEDREYACFCDRFNPNDHRDQGKNFWLLKFYLRNERPVHLEVGTLHQFWFLLDPSSDELVLQDDSKCQWLVTYLMEKVRHNLNERAYSELFQAGFFLYWQYGEAAVKQNQSLSEYVWTSREDILRYSMLNYLGEVFFLMGEASQRRTDHCQAKKFYQMIIDRFNYAQVSDPRGWFWKPAEAALQRLHEIEASGLCPGPTKNNKEEEITDMRPFNKVELDKIRSMSKRSIIYRHIFSVYEILWSLAVALILARILLRWRSRRTK